MSARVLETWINETLKDAEHLNLPGAITNSDQLMPIKRYNIDRKTLNSSGLSSEMVDRIYRALYVYSFGFHQMVTEALKHTKDKMGKSNLSAITALWKTFHVLMEYCCRTDYVTLVEGVTKQHNDDLKKMEIKYKTEFAKMSENEIQLRKDLQTVRDWADEVNGQRLNERKMRLKLEEEHNQSMTFREAEVGLRMAFEGKLNEMHK